MKTGWTERPLSEVVMSRPGNNKIIKGKQSDQPGEGLVQAYSASGPDVWVTTADYKQPGVVISAVGARCGKTFIADGEWTAIANTHVLLPGKEVDGRWLWYRTNDESFWIKGGAAQPFVKVKDTLQQLCKFPPLAEQRRIVGILDEAFEGLATAKANAEQNLQNARALFESHLQAVFTQRGDGWVEKPLETVAAILNGYAFKSTDFSPKVGAKCIKITNVGVREFVCEADSYLPNSFASIYDAVSVKSGSIVLALTRTIIAGGLKVAVVPDEFDGALLNQRVASIIADHKHLNGAFLFLYLSTQSVVEYVKERVNTLMQPNLSITDLRSMPIPVPPLRKQDEITEQLDGLREETQRLESLYQRRLTSLDELKKSLLHRAFSGQL